MKYFLILVLLFPISAFAEEDIRVEILDGKKFVCFDEVVSRDLFQLRVDYPKLQEKIKIQYERIETQKNMIITLEDANDSLNQQNNILLTKVGELEERIESGDKWYRSPYFLISVGIVCGAALSVGIMYAVR